MTSKREREKQAKARRKAARRTPTPAGPPSELSVWSEWPRALLVDLGAGLGAPVRHLAAIRGIEVR